MKIVMDNCNDMESEQEVDISSLTDQSFCFNLQAFGDNEDDTLSECSSGGLEIDISETDQGDGREYKRKRLEETDSSMPELLNNMEEEIERQLDSKAAKSNLTVANVKNILKHVITNEHVLSMVRHTMTGSDDYSSLSQDVPFGPTLTRAKTKELLMTLPSMAWPMTPVKKSLPSKCQVLIEQELPEDSSDEEYRPTEEEQSDEEKENESMTSDLESQPATPASVTTLKPLTNNDCATQTSWSDDILFKRPQENIGQRTRSKLSLSDTPLETIERAFIPPDITTDMYDSVCDDEDWQNFLKDFTEPLLTDINDTFDDDYEADPEYNVLADEETVDKEELRVDKAVKIPRKELNALMDELFEYADMMSSDDEEPKSDCLPAEVEQGTPLADVSVEDPSLSTASAEQNEIENDVKHIADINVQGSLLAIAPEESNIATLITRDQRLLLDQQMRKHVQLLTQHFLQTFCHPQLFSHASELKNHLMSLKFLVSYNNSAFNAANLTDAVELIERWEKHELASESEAKKYKNFILEEIKIGKLYRQQKRLYTCKFPLKFLDTVSKSKVFMYPLLLPPMPFRCDGFKQSLYLPSEDQLIAIGLEQFMKYASTHSDLFAKKWCMPHVLPLLTEYLLPTKDPKKMYFHIRKCSYIKDNPIKYYFDNNKAPGTTHYVIPFDSNLVMTPCEQRIELLPNTWKKHIHPKIQLSNVKERVMYIMKVQKPV